MEWSVPKRTGKIFMDYNMNVRGKTLNVAYSPRGEPGAPVSMPLDVGRAGGAHPLDFTHHAMRPSAWRAPAIAGTTRWTASRASKRRWTRRQGVTHGCCNLPLEHVAATNMRRCDMAARSIACLTVSFGLVSIPVKLYLGHRGEQARSPSTCCTRPAARA